MTPCAKATITVGAYGFAIAAFGGAWLARIALRALARVTR